MPSKSSPVRTVASWTGLSLHPSRSTAASALAATVLRIGNAGGEAATRHYAGSQTDTVYGFEDGFVGSI